MKLSPLARKINRRAVASFFIVQIGTLLVSEFFSQMYNPSRNVDFGGRVLLALNPKLLVFVLVICTGTGFLIRAYLKPLWRELETAEDRREPKNSRRARLIAVRLPWSLIIYNSVLWIFAIILFYFLNGKAMPSGLPFSWVLAIKLTESFAGSLINAFIIDSYLKEPKQLLNITSLNKHERDRFIEKKEIIIPMATGLILITHLAFVSWFFFTRTPDLQGPTSIFTAFLLVGILFEALVFYISWLSKKQDTIQFTILDEQILRLASSDSADLNRKVAILNFDETGRITESLNLYIETLQTMITEISQGCSTLKENDSGLTASMFEAAEKIREINSAVKNAETVIEDQTATTGDSTTAVQKITARIADLHAAVSQQTGSVNNSSAGIEQMIANIQSVTGNVQRINSACQDLLAAANLGKGKIEESNTLIEHVVESSTMLMDANKVISSIAAQTNLLAMNAAIEAAHAGSAGSGFAVVADEIRSLAEKSSKQSSIVNSQLKEVRTAIENAVAASRDASSGFDNVLGLITTVTDMEKETSSAMEEQRIGSDQVAQTLSEMKQTTELVNAAAQELADDSSRLNQAITDLKECSERVRREMDAIMGDTLAMNATFEEVAELKKYNSEIFKSVSTQVGRFIL